MERARGHDDEAVLPSNRTWDLCSFQDIVVKERGSRGIVLPRAPNTSNCCSLWHSPASSALCKRNPPHTHCKGSLSFQPQSLPRPACFLGQRRPIPLMVRILKSCVGTSYILFDAWNLPLPWSGGGGLPWQLASCHLPR